MRLDRRVFLGAGVAALAASLPGAAWSEVQAPGLQPDPVAELAAIYRTEVDKRLAVPDAELPRYLILLNAALLQAGVELLQPQYLVLVDRNPQVQAALLLWCPAPGAIRVVGASPVSTGRPGSFDHFETPLGVFAHSLANPDFRAEGTRNSNGIRGYGAKGLRVFDLGWQRVAKGWGDGAVVDMRLQMHATDLQLLEPRLGSIQSKGCIRIPASLNRLLDHHGVLDADYVQAVAEGHKLWVLDAQHTPVAHAGRYLVVVDSGRGSRPDWAPAPGAGSRKPAA